MKLVDNLISLINKGRDGKNIGLPSGFPKLDKYIFGLQKRYIMTIGGDSGSGKSSLALYMYAYRPIMEAIVNKKKINILYFSFEMNNEVLMAKLLSMFLWEQHGKTMSYEKILSLTEKMSDEDYTYIQSSVEWMRQVEKILTIVDKAVTPKAVYAITKEWIKQFGVYKDVSETQSIYVPYDPDHFLIGVVDHIALLSGNSEGGRKGKIDECCDYMISLRNQASMSWCIVQQLNRGFKSMERRQSDFKYIQLDDFSDSSGPVHASEVVLALFDAHRERMKTCEGYQVSILLDRFRLIQCLKNRFGSSNKNLGVYFEGATGYWSELDKPDEMDYGKFKKEEEPVESQIQFSLTM